MEQGMCGITEQQADELCNAFEKIVNANEDFLKFCKDTFSKAMMDNALNVYMKTSERYLYYTLRYNSAWFFTRWFWKRKMEKAMIANRKAKECVEEINVLFYGKDNELMAEIERLYKDIN